MKDEGKIQSRVGAALLPLHRSPPPPGGTLSTPVHPTLVRRISRTASVARPSHRSLNEEVCGCSHSHAFPISLHIFLACGAHARHLVKRWCRDWGSPLAHNQYSLVSIFLIRQKWDPITA